MTQTIPLAKEDAVAEPELRRAIAKFWGEAQGSPRNIYDRFRDPVLVKGNRHAIGDAIRNLIENAVLHSPARSEVLVRTSPDGRVSVAD